MTALRARTTQISTLLANTAALVFHPWSPSPTPEQRCIQGSYSKPVSFPLSLFAFTHALNLCISPFPPAVPATPTAVASLKPAQ